MEDTPLEERLVDVAIGLFGTHGLDGVATRAIAEAAGARQSAISYHFGSKERLYLACAERIAARVRDRLAGAAVELAATSDPAEAAARVEALLCAMLVVMLDPAMAPAARFVMREQMSPTPAFDALWEGAMRHVADPLAALVRVASASPLSPRAARLRCFTLLGQVFAFRFGHASLLRVTGWERVGPREAALARQAIVANARAVLSAPADRESRHVR